MNYKDFTLEVALNLNHHNVDDFKNAAIKMVIDVKKMNGEQLASMLNYRDYSNLTTVIDKKDIPEASKKIMKDTDYVLNFALELYQDDTSSFDWFNERTKQRVSEQILEFGIITKPVLKYILNNVSSKLYTSRDRFNPLFKIIKTGKKEFINMTVNHKNFTSIHSQYPLRELLYNDKLLSVKTFDKVFRRNMEIIQTGRGWNTDFSEELAPIVASKYLKKDHLSLLTEIQLNAMIDYAIKNDIQVNDEISEFFFSLTQNSIFLNSETKEMFIF